MLRNLKDAWGWVQRLVRRIERLESGAQLGNSSITKGRMRFIGGLLRVDSGGRVEIVGTWRFIGNGAITGDVVAEGKWTQNGEWEFNGPGDIAGDVELTGDLDVLGDGRIRVGGVLITPQDDGRIIVGTGSSQIIIDPSQFKVGPAFRMDPAHSSDGAQLEFGTSGQSTVFGDDSGIQIVNLTGDTVRNLSVLAEGFNVVGLPQLPGGMAARYVVLGSDNMLYFTAGVGGGGDGSPGPVAGDWQWPFSPSTTDPVLGVFGMRLNPVTGIWALHAGQDFSVPGGAPIPAIGDGVVEAVTGGDARGFRVRINHGGGIASENFHMQAPSHLAVGTEVSRGDIIGYVGTTGSSTGNHLHLEIHVSGTPVDPALFFAAQGQ